jgi:hypothetical protein
MEALVDAGCDGKRCYTIALSDGEGTDAPSVVKVVTFPESSRIRR